MNRAGKLHRCIEILKEVEISKAVAERPHPKKSLATLGGEVFCIFDFCVD
jgi:hypothetical protein